MLTEASRYGLGIIQLPNSMTYRAVQVLQIQNHKNQRDFLMPVLPVLLDYHNSLKFSPITYLMNECEYECSVHVRMHEFFYFLSGFKISVLIPSCTPTQYTKLIFSQFFFCIFPVFLLFLRLPDVWKWLDTLILIELYSSWECLQVFNGPSLVF